MAGSDKAPPSLTRPDFLIFAECKCGETLAVPSNGWKLAFIGRIELKCPRCPNVMIAVKESFL